MPPLLKSFWEFNDGTQIVSFLIPSIHCSSMYLVLEAFKKLNSGCGPPKWIFPKNRPYHVLLPNELTLEGLGDPFYPNWGMNHTFRWTMQRGKNEKSTEPLFTSCRNCFILGTSCSVLPWILQVQEFWLIALACVPMAHVCLLSASSVLLGKGLFYFGLQRASFQNTQYRCAHCFGNHCPVSSEVPLKLAWDWGTGFSIVWPGWYFSFAGQIFQQKNLCLPIVWTRLQIVFPHCSHPC